MRRLHVLLATVLCGLGVLVPASTTQADAPAPADTPAAAPAQTLRNPITLGTADPQLSYADGYYYLTYTEVSVISLTRARSIEGLATAPRHIVWQGANDVHTRCCDLWAPELHRIGGRWYIYYTADDGNISNHNMLVLQSSTSDPLGPYHFQGQLTSGPFSIDATVLQQPDGSVYLLWSRGDTQNVNSLVIAPMANPWTLSAPGVELSRPTNPWETEIRPVNEGPAVLQHDGKLFVVFSVTACESPDYSLAMITYNGQGSLLDKGNWTKSTGPVFTRDDANWVFGPGHNSFFNSPDGRETWIAYHAVTSSSGAVYGSCGGDRSMRVQMVTWNADGTPDFGVPAAAWQSQPLPSGDPGSAPIVDGTYRLTPMHAQSTVLSACKAGVDIDTYAGAACQQWQLRSAGGHSYQLVNHGGTLGTAACATTRGAAVDVGRHAGECADWYLDPVGDGSFRISHRLTGLALDVGGCRAAPGTGLDAWPYWSSSRDTCQQWQLTPAR